MGGVMIIWAASAIPAWVLIAEFVFRLEGGRTFFCFAKRK
jgi:hypothetical protein